MLQIPLEESVQSPAHSVPVREPSTAEQSHPTLSWVLKVAPHPVCVPWQVDHCSTEAVLNVCLLPLCSASENTEAAEVNSCNFVVSSSTHQYVYILPYFPYLSRKCFKRCSLSWIKPVPNWFHSCYNSHTLEVEILLQKITLGYFETLFIHLFIQQAGTEYSFGVTCGTRYLGTYQKNQGVGLWKR